MTSPSHRRMPAAARRSLALARQLSSSALLLALAACGGGGGSAPADGGTPSTPTTPTTPGTPTDPAAAALARALASGNAADVPLAAVLAAAQAELAAQRTSYAALKRALFGLDASGAATADSPRAIDWNPTHDSSFFKVLDQGRARVVLPGNWRFGDNSTGSGAALGVAGEFPGSPVRFAAFGGNPLAERGNAAMDRFMKNLIGWLTPAASAPGSTFKIVTAHLPGKSTYWFPHELKVNAWLAEQFPGATINGQPGAQATTEDRCDGDKLDACLRNADLLVIGRQQGPAGADSQAPDDYPAGWNGDTIMRAVAAARARGTPVLYLHHYRDSNDLADRLLDTFGLEASNNYFRQEGPKAFDPTTLPALPGQMADTQALLQRLEQGRFATTWSGCKNDLGKILCEPSGSFAGDAAYASEFFTPASNLRAGLRSLDAKGVALFDEPGYALEKLLVLLGDKYRATLQYPLDKTSAGADFQRALFADMTAYINRAHAAVARNLGNFAEMIPATTPAVSRTVGVAPPATGTRDHMTGLYVMPGRTVTLARTDGGAAAVTVGINMLRDTSRPYNVYDRPLQLASPRVSLAPGARLSLTSPYGGPLFVFVEKSADATAVQIKVDGATTHPLLRDARDPAQVAAFKAELASTPTSWVGITTDFVTVHSNLTNFRKTMKTYGDDVDKLVADLWTYMVKDTYELAGFNSASGSFALPAAVTAFCAKAGWDCGGTQHRRDAMQHVISDHYARCGAGCSGNPYDQNWALDPLGWGETHEIGHNLQRARLNIYGGQSTEVSNNIFPMHKQAQFNRTPAGLGAPKLRGGGAAKLGFDVIRESLSMPDPTAHVRQQRWSDTSYAADAAFRLQFYRQLVEFARHYNASFVDGWELYTLMYLLDRNFAASASAGAWPGAAAGLGFGTYAAYPSNMDGNDFMVIASSRIIGRDMRPVFDLWGVTYSAAASAQVTAHALPAAAKLLFPMSDVNRSGSGVGAPIAMTATAVYPAGF